MPYLLFGTPSLRSIHRKKVTSSLFYDDNNLHQTVIEAFYVCDRVGILPPTTDAALDMPHRDDSYAEELLPRWGRGSHHDRGEIDEIALLCRKTI